MLDKTANILAALLLLAASATAADVLPEEIAPAQPQKVDGDAVTFDTMDSIPFENAAEPPDDPPAQDNGVRTPAPDNTALPVPVVPPVSQPPATAP